MQHGAQRPADLAQGKQTNQIFKEWYHFHPIFETTLFSLFLSCILDFCIIIFYSGQANKIYTFLQLGLTRGVQGMGQGLLEGVTGIIRQPIEVIILCEHK